MKRVWILLGLVILLGAGAWAYVTFVDPSLLPQNAVSSSETAETDAIEEAGAELESVIWASGMLPTHRMGQFGFPARGHCADPARQRGRLG